MGDETGYDLDEKMPSYLTSLFFFLFIYLFIFFFLVRSFKLEICMMPIVFGS